MKLNCYLNAYTNKLILHRIKQILLAHKQDLHSLIPAFHLSIIQRSPNINIDQLQRIG